MVKILEVIGKRPRGGIGAFVLNYQSHFVGQEVQLDYLIFSDEETGEFDNKVKKLNSNVYVLPELKNSRFFAIWFKINKFFRDHGKNYDAVHLHSVNIAFMVFKAAKINGIQHLIAHSHATLYSDKFINGIRNRILCLGLKKHATHFLACSLAAGDFLYGKENREKVLIFNNAIECEKFSFKNEVREKYRSELQIENSLVIGHVGRFNEQKNHKYLIEIFNEVVKINRNATLLLIGDGPLKKEIEEEVRRRNLTGNVKFLGQRNDVDKLLMAMDVFVLPSLYEGLPVVGVEAQATGLVCIMSDTITKEVDLGKVFFKSIEAKPYEWAEKICNVELVTTDQRGQYSQIVASKGYEIETESKKLYNFYKTLGRADRS